MRALLAYKRGEPRVYAMLRVPTPEEEDRRRLVRERKSLTNERVRCVNRVKGLLFGQGVSGYQPLNRDRRKRLEELMTGDGRPLPSALKAQIGRELDRIELLIAQIKDVEKARDAMMLAAQTSSPAPALLLNLKGVGPQFAAVLWSEGLSRHFDNRRQVAAYAGLAPTPWQSGKVDRDPGRVKIRQSQTANDAHPTGLVLATAPARLYTHRLVQRAGDAERRPPKECDDHCACSQAARSNVEIRQRRRRYRRGCADGRLIPFKSVYVISQDWPVLVDPWWTNRPLNRAPKAAVENGIVFLGSNPPHAGCWYRRLRS